MKILVVGAGVAGSAFTAFIKKSGIAEVTVIEQAPAFHNIGYMISLWGNGRRMLKELGIDRHVAMKEGYEFPWDIIENREGHLLKAFNLEPFRALGSTLVMHRADLHKGLVELLAGLDVRFGTTATSIKQKTSGVEVTFNTSESETYDLVVGADGLHSKTREQVFVGKDYLSYYGWGIWMSNLPNSVAHSPDIIVKLGDGRMFAPLPFYDSSTALFVAKVPRGYGKDAATRFQRLSELFSDFKYVPEIILSIQEPEKIFYDDIAHVNMPLWHKGRVVLIGDAQHAVSPIAGMGTSIAMEDAFVLADELQKNAADIDTALSRFAERREKRLKHFRFVVKRLENWGMADGIFATLRDLIFPLMPSSYFVGAIRNFIAADI